MKERRELCILMRSDWGGNSIYGVFSSVDGAKKIAQETEVFGPDTIEVYELDDVNGDVLERHTLLSVDGKHEWKSWKRS